jgi:hypothetical protein
MHSYTAGIGRHLLWRPAATVLGDVFHPLTGSNRALPSTVVRWRAGFASRITGQRLGKETWGRMKGRGLELG